jgi:hypothetical protein
VQLGYLGSCVSGRLEDLRVAAQVLKEREVKPGFRLNLVPTSQKIIRQAVQDCIIADLVGSQMDEWPPPVTAVEIKLPIPAQGNPAPSTVVIDGVPCNCRPATMRTGCRERLPLRFRALAGVCPSARVPRQGYRGPREYGGCCATRGGSPARPARQTRADRARGGQPRRACRHLFEHCRHPHAAPDHLPDHDRILRYQPERLGRHRYADPAQMRDVAFGIVDAQQFRPRQIFRRLAGAPWRSIHCRAA